MYKLLERVNFPHLKKNSIVINKITNYNVNILLLYTRYHVEILGNRVSIHNNI